MGSGTTELIESRTVWLPVRVHAADFILGKRVKVLCDGQVDVTALAVYRCFSIGEARGDICAIGGSFGQGHAGVRQRCGQWLANSE
jgi:hypothetical protein